MFSIPQVNSSVAEVLTPPPHCLTVAEREGEGEETNREGEDRTEAGNRRKGRRGM